VLSLLMPHKELAPEIYAAVGLVTTELMAFVPRLPRGQPGCHLLRRGILEHFGD
jgi:hypothetical protein